MTNHTTREQCSPLYGVGDSIKSIGYASVCVIRKGLFETWKPLQFSLSLSKVLPSLLQGMEVIIVASAVSQLALRSLDKYASTLALHSPPDNGNERTTSRAADSRLSQSTKDGDVEGSISSLEAKLGQLKSQAKALNSPDTFVQYARVSREANKVERELNDKRGRFFITYFSAISPRGSSCS